MRILVLSDLHLEFASFDLKPGLDYDVAILAGDIHVPGHKVVHWARRASVFGEKTPVVYVPGNHEFYGSAWQTELQLMREAAAGTNVHVLFRDSAVIDGVRFLGCTLWTDYALPVEVLEGHFEVDVARGLAEANARMLDFRRIRTDFRAHHPREKPEMKRLTRHLTAEDALAMHWVDRDWLRREIAEPHAGPTVVVTHHGPSSESVAPKYAGDWLNPGFVSHLPDEFFPASVPLWVHGHTHSSMDYMRGGSRVVANPRGYRMRDGSFENPGFRPDLVHELR